VRLFAVMAVTGRQIWAPVVTMPRKARPFGVPASPCGLCRTLTFIQHEGVVLVRFSRMALRFADRS
jgi:hypothetical protein